MGLAPLTPFPSINVTIQQLKTEKKDICIFFHNHPSRPYSQGVFALHNTELLLYTLLRDEGSYFFLIALHLSSHFSPLFTEKQGNRELEAFQRETPCLHADTVAVTVSKICSWAAD